VSRRTTLVGLTGLCATLAACSGSPTQAPPPPPPQPVAAAPIAPAAPKPALPVMATRPEPVTPAAGTAATTVTPHAPAMARSASTGVHASAALPAPVAAKPGMPAPTAATTPGTAASAQPVGSLTRTVETATLVPAAPAVPQSDAPMYEIKGRRDPFTILDVVTGPSGLTVATTKLTGIVRGRSTLALVETSDGIGYILRTGDTLGDGRLVEIGADNVVFAVAAKPGAPPSRVVLKLAAK